MNDTVFSFSEKEKEAMKRHSVVALVLFGSRADGPAREGSDYDIGVLVSDHRALYDCEKRNKIYDALYDILSRRVNKLVDIDIVFLEDAPAELKAHVMKHGTVIFETDGKAFPNFKEKTMLEYADFAPLRRVFEEGVLAQVSS